MSLLSRPRLPSVIAGLTLALFLATPATAEEYPSHVTCAAVTQRGTWRVAACPVELAPGGRLIIYFDLGAPVRTAPGLSVHVPPRKPAPMGVRIDLVALYPGSAKENQVKAVVYNDTEAEVDVVASAWAGE